MNEITIRPIGGQDAAFLKEMLYQSIYTPDGQQPPDRSIIDSPAISKYIKDWGRVGDFGFVAELQNGEPVGSVTARLFDEANKGYGYVDSSTPEIGLAIVTQYRGEGIGTRLLTRLIEEAQKRGIAALSLSVDARNPAVNLYKRFQFVEVGTEGNAITMQLILKKSN